MSELGEGTWVEAKRDFGYDDNIGEVKRGQVFQLGGHINDGGLKRHDFFYMLEPQPKAKDVDAMPQCGPCGRRFGPAGGEWARDLCGQSHEIDALTTEAEKLVERRQDADGRIDRVMSVGQ